MDFSWPAEYLEYRDRVIQFAEAELNDDIASRDHSGSFSRKHWDKCGDFGIQGLAAPAAYGGALPEIDLLRAALAMEGLGYGCRDNGLGIALNAHMWAVMMSISLFGDEGQKEKYLRPMASGKLIGCHALTEADSGSDVFEMDTTAKKVDGGYVLNGTKVLVTLAPVSDVAVVFANVKPELGKWGVTAFIADTSMDGYERHDTDHKMGLRTVPLGKITFNDCFVPDENRLGPEGAGFSISNHSLEYDRCCIMACKLGAMARQVNDAVKFAKEHKRFGQTINNFQAVTHRIADMKLRLETSRLLLYKMAWLKKNDQPAMLEAAMLKLHLSESFVTSSLDAIRTRGGNGYLTEFEVERDLRDSIGGLLYAGTSDIQRNIIARFLGL